MNVYCGVGLLVNDVEILKSKDGKPWLRNTLAINDFGTTNYVPFKAFGKTAELFARIKKGQKISIHGYLKSGSYKNGQGAIKSTLDVFVTDVQFFAYSEKKVQHDEEVTRELEEVMAQDDAFADEDTPF